MQRVSIRALSASVIRRSVAANEILGVTNKGVLIGVLVPLTQAVIERLASMDADELGAKAAEAEAGMDSVTLWEVLQEEARSDPEPRTFMAVSIREISGARLEEASAAGKSLVIASAREPIAVFLPIDSRWVESLVESSVSRFLSSPPALDNEPPGASGQDPSERGAVFATPARITRAIAGRAISRQRAIGIRLVGDARHNRTELVGVVTDGLALTTYDSVELELSSLEEAYVLDEIIALVERMCSRMPEGSNIIGVGLEVGGHVWQGRVVRSANIHWNHFPFADHLSDAVQLPVVLENDANALAIYEQIQGVGTDNFAVILITHHGIGCGLVLDGRVFRGSQGMAGELGHVSVGPAAPDAQLCRCGNVGCLEVVATPGAIERALRRTGVAERYEDVSAEPGGPAYQAFADAGSAFGKGLAALLNLMNPSAVVLYGPLELLGHARTFHIERPVVGADAESPTGMWRVYTDAMLEGVRGHVFSTAASDCRFVVKSASNEVGAKAAAACVIRATRGSLAGSDYPMGIAGASTTESVSRP